MLVRRASPRALAPASLTLLKRTLGPQTHERDTE